MRITFWPPGPTSSASMSEGKVWLTSTSVAVTLLITPLKPETWITEGYGDAGQGDDLNRVTLRFDDAALVSLPANSAILPGIDYKPTNFGDGDYFAPPAPTEPYGSTLSVFNGTNPNGDWLLYIMDDQGSDAGVVYGGWRLTFTTGAPVPLLTIERVANTVTLSWPATATGYTLESKDILSSPDPWDTVTSSPPVAGGRFTVNLGIAGGNKFFRLRK